MERTEALAVVGERFPAAPMVLCCGATAREMAALGRPPNHLHVLDSMGLPTSIGLGLSLGLEGSAEEWCVVVEGDGGILMNLSSLATIGALQPSKLLVVLLDNGVHGSTGGQPSIAAKVRIGPIASACGLRVWEASDQASLGKAIDDATEGPGPHLLWVHTQPGNRPVPYLQDDPRVLFSGFAEHLASRQATGEEMR